MVRLTQPRIRFCRSADGVRIAYTVSGEGPPLLQAPTWLTHLELDWRSPAWCEWVSELSAHHTLVRHDMRGCGLSDRNAPEQSLASWVADLEAVADAAGLERFPLFGFCQGAAIAAAFAALHPERVSRLVLYGAFVQGALVRQPSSPRREEVETLAELIACGWGSSAPAFREVFSCLLMPDGKAERVRALTELEGRSATPAMARRLWLAFHSIDITELVQRIQAPALLLHSRGDGVVPFAAGRLTATLVPRAQFVPLEGRNHILQPEDPAWAVLWPAVRAFLEQDEARATPGSAGTFGELTRRERELLDLVARGRSNAAIADELAISPKTVRNHLSRILDKIGAAHRSEAIVLARQAGFGREVSGLPS
jgi:pimeloyl-ACP methyl ester carboxylesterase/DNA-binding CsgD family transcriptional regulator